jgi:hypothetical protein
MPKLTAHVATLGGAGIGGAADAGLKYFFRQVDGTYATLATETGIDKATADQQDAPLYDVKELLASGIVVRLSLSIKDGTRIKSGKILVTRDKVTTALDALKNKTFRGGTIVSVRFPRRMAFY